MRVPSIPRTAFSDDITHYASTDYLYGLAMQAIPGGLLLLATAGAGVLACRRLVKHSGGRPQDERSHWVGVLMGLGLLFVVVQTVLSGMALFGPPGAIRHAGNTLADDVLGRFGALEQPLTRLRNLTQATAPAIHAHLGTIPDAAPWLQSELGAIGSAPGPDPDWLGNATYQVGALATFRALVEGTVSSPEAAGSIDDALRQALDALASVRAEVETQRPQVSDAVDRAVWWAIPALFLYYGLLCTIAVAVVWDTCQPRVGKGAAVRLVLVLTGCAVLGLMVCVLWPVAVALDDACGYEAGYEFANGTVADACLRGDNLLDAAVGADALGTVQYRDRLVFPQFTPTSLPGVESASAGVQLFEQERLMAMHTGLVAVQTTQYLITPLLDATDDVRAAMTCGVVTDDVHAMRALVCGTPALVVAWCLVTALGVACALLVLWDPCARGAKGPAYARLAPRSPPLPAPALR